MRQVLEDLRALMGSAARHPDWDLRELVAEMASQVQLLEVLVDDLDRATAAARRDVPLAVVDPSTGRPWPPQTVSPRTLLRLAAAAAADPAVDTITYRSRTSWRAPVAEVIPAESPPAVEAPEGGVCAACGAPGGVDRGEPLHLIACTPCWSAAQVEPLPPARTASAEHLRRAWRAEMVTDRDGHCTHCGAPVEWYVTVRGRRVALEPGSWPSLPSGVAWRVDSAGVAHLLGGRQPGGSVRMCHFDVCPHLVRPAPSVSALRDQWTLHCGRSREC